MMKVIETPQELMQFRQKLQGSVGFVPTMGALHQGHETLLQRAVSENNHCILSIFVNPTQFNNSQDLAKYPKTWEADLEMARKNNVTAVFAPRYETMYPDHYRFKVVESESSKNLCGAHRPGHFDGVLSVVMKLLNIVNPTKAYFGEKDFQQLSLIRDMVSAFFLPYEIIPVATVREKDGLAMSSRNLRLSFAEREKAPLIYKTVSESKTAEEAEKKLSALGFKVDYVTDIEDRRYVAAFLGEVRLIDNVQI